MGSELKNWSAGNIMALDLCGCCRMSGTRPSNQKKGTALRPSTTVAMQVQELTRPRDCGSMGWFAGLSQGNKADEAEDVTVCVVHCIAANSLALVQDVQASASYALRHALPNQGAPRDALLALEQRRCDVWGPKRLGWAA
jgi:hypothetical protein